MTNPAARTTITGISKQSLAARRTRLLIDRQPDSSKIFVTGIGLKITAELTYDDWRQAGHRLSGMVNSSSWCLGDWLVYGMDNYQDRYRKAIDTVGLHYQTLRNYFWIARQFPMERRRVQLSFQHHAEVASLSPEKQDLLLDRAERLMWTTKELRAHVRDERANNQCDDIPDYVDLTALPRIRVPSGQLAKWRLAADQADTKFDSWLIETLNRAAEQVTAAPSAAGPPQSGLVRGTEDTEMRGHG